MSGGWGSVSRRKSKVRLFRQDPGHSHYSLPKDSETQLAFYSEDVQEFNEIHEDISYLNKILKITKKEP